MAKALGGKAFFSIIVSIFILLGSSMDTLCRENGLKFLRNFSHKEYNARAQNWVAVQNKRGIIYVGNTGGLLEYDGVSWRKYDIPSKTVYSLALDGSGTLFIGGENEFGFLAPGQKGSRQYQSLSHHLEKDKKNISGVRGTHWLHGSIYFRSSKALIRWKNGEIKILEPEQGRRFFGSFTCRGKLYLYQTGTGLHQVMNFQLQPVQGGDTFADKTIAMIVPYGPEHLLIATRKDGLFLYDHVKAKPFDTDADDYVKDKRIYRGIKLRSTSSGPEEFALATLEGGLVIIDRNGRLKHIFDKSSGLQDDSLNRVFEDVQGNLWLALENGITKIEYNSPFSLFQDRDDLRGRVLAITRHGPKNNLYIGTTLGLFCLTSQPSANSFRNPAVFHKIEGIPKDCFFVLSTGDLLLAATTEGVFQVGEKEHSILTDTPSYTLVRSRIDRNRIWAGTKKGLSSIYRQKDLSVITQEIGNIDREIRTIAEDDEGNLWLGPLIKDVIKISFPEPGNIHLYDKKDYGPADGLSTDQVRVYRIGGYIMFAGAKGILRFDKNKGRFIPDLTLGPRFAGGPEGNLVFRLKEDRNNNIWFHSWDRNFLAEKQPNGTFSILEIPFLRLPPAQVDVFYPEPHGNTVWFGGSEGLIKYDTQFKKRYDQPYQTLIRKVFINGVLIVNGNPSGKEKEAKSLEIEYKDRNLRFEVAAAFYEAESETKYRYLLDGYDDQWSAWTSESHKEYTNIDSGRYTFRVQAQNVYRQLSREALFEFKVLPPFYYTWYALLFYSILVFTAVFYIVKWRSGKLEREKRKLQLIVEDRTREINEKNLQLESHTAQLKEQSEKLKELDEAKSRFFANISHEFRTPLTLIMGPLEQMIAENMDNNRQRKLNLMLRNSQRLLGLINQLLELSKFESGKMKLHASEQNIISFLKGLAAAFDPVIEKYELELIFQAKEENISLYFDPEKLEEVVYNLLSNAVKFTPPGGRITVTVNRNTQTEEGFPAGVLDISVSDTGPGIPREQLSYIFDRFYQSDSTSEHHRKGSGIGLSIAQEIIELHQGKINVHSHEGKGTEFIIRLPMGSAHLSPEQIVVRAEPATPKKIPGELLVPQAQDRKVAVEADDTTGAAPEMGTGSTDPLQPDKEIILVIEDSDDVKEYIKSSLEPQYKVVEASGGSEGLQKAKEIIPDLIISDVMMPGFDGYRLCRELKNCIDTSHIPIILLTARAAEDSIVKGLETGADDYITKPFSTKILSARIKNLIDLRRHMQQSLNREMTMQPVKMPVSNIDKQFIKKLKAVLKENISDPDFNIDQLCKKMNLSQPTMYRKINALSGESPTEFIRSYRLKRGAELLKQNFGSVLEVAFEVGFSSANYFTKCFKKKFHQLPSTYLASEVEP
jgi:signal transduction histidine kinase/DNA-binding NarL/FixJ family response regulator